MAKCGRLRTAEDHHFGARDRCGRGHLYSYDSVYHTPGTIALGLRRCRICARINNKKSKDKAKREGRYKVNLEAKRASYRRCRSKVMAYQYKYYRRNKEKIKKTCNAYVKKHKRRTQIYKKEWSEAKKLKRFGLSRERYDAILAEQGGMCRICSAKPNGRLLAIDHCHSTNAIRGILCGVCNVGLGHFRDNSDLLMAAAKYLLEAKLVGDRRLASGNV